MSIFASESTSSASPMEPRRREANSRFSSSTDSVAVQTLIPAPIAAGVFGMTRMIRSEPVAFLMVAIGTPAMIEMITAPARLPPWSDFASWGLMARMTTSAPLAASSTVPAVRTPNSFSMEARRSGTTSQTAVDSFWSTPALRPARSMAVPIAPPPMSAAFTGALRRSPGRPVRGWRPLRSRLQSRWSYPSTGLEGCAGWRVCAATRSAFATRPRPRRAGPRS